MADSAFTRTCVRRSRTPVREFFDFNHTVLPTTLLLEDFYEQYYRLYTESIPLRNFFAFMSKYRLRDVPANLAKFRRWSKRLRKLYVDYGRAWLDGFRGPGIESVLTSLLDTFLRLSGQSHLQRNTGGVNAQ